MEALTQKYKEETNSGKFVLSHCAGYKYIEETNLLSCLQLNTITSAPSLIVLVLNPFPSAVVTTQVSDWYI